MLRIRDVYPGSRILIFTHPGSRIPDPKTATKERGEKNLLFHKIANYFSFEVLKKKIWANIQRIIELFTQKIVTKLSKIWIWDPGSGIRKKPIPDPGSRGQKGTVSQIPDPGSGPATLILTMTPLGAPVRSRAQASYLFPNSVLVLYSSKDQQQHLVVLARISLMTFEI